MEIEIHVIHYLVISTIMMFCGIYGFFTRKNLLALLISVELMLNATNINFAVFNRYLFRIIWKVISSVCLVSLSQPQKPLLPLPLLLMCTAISNKS